MMKIQDKYKNIDHARILELKTKIKELEISKNRKISNIGFICSIFRTENLCSGWIKGVASNKKDTPYNFIPKNDFWGAKAAKIELIYQLLQSNAIANDRKIACPSLEVIAVITNATVQWVAKVQKRLIKNRLIFFSRAKKNSLKYFSVKINQLKNLLSIAKEKIEGITNKEKASAFREIFKKFAHSLNRFMKISQFQKDNYLDYITSDYNFLTDKNPPEIRKQNNIQHPDLDL